MKSTYLLPWFKMTTWYFRLSQLLEVSNVKKRTKNHSADADRIFMLVKNMCWPYPAWEMKLRPLPAEGTEGVMYYDPAATGERIQNLRRDREVTQEQLAIDLNISDRYMRNLEKGEKVPSVDLFVELRERFGSSLDYIVLGVSASQREQELQDQLQMLRKELKEMQRRILVMLEILGESA